MLRSRDPSPRAVREGVPPLSREGPGPSLDFDALPRAFGSFQVRATFGDGRFGPVFLAEDEGTGRRVVVRTFSGPMRAEQQTTLIDALHALCELPLDHPAVARPLTSGVEGGVPYLVHAYLEGTPADEFLETHGPQRLADLAPRITQAAAAIDFAAVAAVHHGALTLRDVIIGPDGTGISGFGLYQALGQEVSSADDVRGLATVTLQLLDERDHERLAAVVSNLPETALAFAAAIQQIVSSPILDTAPSTLVDTPTGVDVRIAPPPSASSSELSFASSPDVDGGLANARLGDAPIVAEPLVNARFADAPLANASLHDEIQWTSEAVTDVPLRADGPSPTRPSESGVASQAAPERPSPAPTSLPERDASSERRNGLFAASAKGEAARAKDEAARTARPEPVATPRPPRIAPSIQPQNTLFSAAARDVDHHRSAKRVWIPLTIAAALVLGALAGFGGGYFVGQHDRPSAQVPTTAPEPTATNGQAYTEAPLRDSGNAATDHGSPSREAGAATESTQRERNQPPASTTPEPAPRAAAAPSQTPPPQRSVAPDARPRTGDVRARTPRAPVPTTGALFVDSHPTAAQVFVDGALVGRTPLLLNDVRTGEHRVRLALPMHRTWATSVDVVGGERSRVAASLEETQE